MKTRTIICTLVTLGLITGAFALAIAAEKKDKQAKLAAQAKITKAEAEEIALAKTPGGKVKDAELERENGKLIWSFDITKEGSKDITEVQVDAQTGEVLAVEEESASKEAVERGKEGKKKKAEEEEDDDDQDEDHQDNDQDDAE